MTLSDIALFILAAALACAALWWVLPHLSRKPATPTLADRMQADLVAAQHEAYEAWRDIEVRDAHACMLERRIQKLVDDLAALKSSPITLAGVLRAPHGVIPTLTEEATR